MENEIIITEEQMPVMSKNTFLGNAIRLSGVFLAGLLAGMILTAVSVTPAKSEEISTVTTSGLLFKDTITVNAFDDPDYSGVTCYVTTAGRSLSFDDPSDSSIACRKIGEITSTSFKDKKEVFSSSLDLFFKYQQVDRFYDAKRNVLVYLSYTRKVDGENHAHSISVVPLGN